MNSNKPYLVRAIYEWCVDQGFTPYLAVSVDDRTRVPREYIKDGQIVLNVGPEATQKLQMGNDEITFHARFNGASFSVIVPVGRVSAIYARENGEGMMFEVTEEEGADAGTDAVAEPPEVSPDEEGEGKPRPPSGRPHLTRVK